MATRYQDWLAANVLAEEQAVTYRMLSRALKVHVNTAKQMLYDFHQTQNARRPSSVSATYLLSGVRRPAAAVNGTNGSHKDGKDTPMAEASVSGAMSSSMPEPDDQETEMIQVTTITLVGEATLESIKAQHESISSIQIYALSPGPIKDLHVLSESNRRLAIDYAGEDSLETWKTYGTIHNPNAQRRATRIPPPAPAPIANVTAGMKSAPASTPRSTATTTASSASGKAAETEASSQATPPSSTTAKKPPTAKRQPSDLMASFGKTAASNAKLKLNTPADGGDDAEDEPMEDTPAAQEETAEQRARAEAARKEKADKEAKLKAMMEGDDEQGEEQEDADEEMKEAWSESEHEAEPEPEPEPKAEPPAAPAEQGVTTTGGRRRGRRRVMKKKTTKDAEGYLVTKEEAAWESFSEDEAPRPAKVEVSSSASSQTKGEAPAAKKGATGAAGGAAKKGQGSIMSFFKK